MNQREYLEVLGIDHIASRLVLMGATIYISENLPWIDFNFKEMAVTYFTNKSLTAPKTWYIENKLSAERYTDNTKVEQFEVLNEVINLHSLQRNHNEH